MKTWIDWMSQIVGGMLFQGGYITSPTMVVVGRPARAAGDVRHEPECRVVKTRGGDSQATQQVELSSVADDRFEVEA